MVIYLFNFEDIEIKSYIDNLYFFNYSGVGNGNYFFSIVFKMQLEDYIKLLSKYDVEIQFGNIFFKNKKEAEDALELLISNYILNELCK